MPHRDSRSPSPRRRASVSDRPSRVREGRESSERNSYRRERRSSYSRDNDSRPHRDSEGHHRDKRRRKSEVSPAGRDRDHDRDRDSTREKPRRRKDQTPSDDDDLLDLRALGISKITEDDYFLKSSEFRYWLKDSRGRYLDEMSSEGAHKYFKKFVRRWNDGALAEKYYQDRRRPSSSQTGHKWQFASDGSRIDPKTLASIRRDVDLRTHSLHPIDASQLNSLDASPAPPPLEPSDSDEEDIGPSLPSQSNTHTHTHSSAADRQLEKETVQDRRKLERKAERKELYSRAEEIAPKGVGKEGKLAEKKAMNEENKKYREKDATAGLEVDESTLMGEESSFQAALRARDGAKNRREAQREAEMADRRAAEQERLAERKKKESETMDMFRAMAKQRFG